MIHGTNKPSGVGMRVSHGCIRMYPEDIANLFELSQSGLKVTLIDEPYKVGFHNGKMLLEAHVQKAGEKDDPSDLSSVVKSVVELTGRQLTKKLKSRALEIIKENTGMPQTLGDIPEGANNTPAAYFLQLGEFPSVQSARQMSTFFSGLQVATLLSATPGNKYCRVLVGPFHLKSKADGELRRIHSATGIEGMVLPKMETQSIPHCSPEL
jgi:L,D-transpeptidase ErfK/SrfK